MPDVLGNLAKAPGPVVATAGIDFDIVVGDVNLNAIAIELDFVNPPRAFRHTLDL